jgi:hypothetical protein
MVIWEECHGYKWEERFSGWEYGKKGTLDGIMERGI